MKTNMVIKIKAFKGGKRSKESIMTLPFFKQKNELKKTKSQIVKGEVCSRSKWLGYWREKFKIFLKIYHNRQESTPPMLGILLRRNTTVLFEKKDNSLNNCFRGNRYLQTLL